jgi:hypothetical protein
MALSPYDRNLIERRIEAVEDELKATAFDANQAPSHLRDLWSKMLTEIAELRERLAEE